MKGRPSLVCPPSILYIIASCSPSAISIPAVGAALNASAIAFFLLGLPFSIAFFLGVGSSSSPSSSSNSMSSSFSESSSSTSTTFLVGTNFFVGFPVGTGVLFTSFFFSIAMSFYVFFLTFDPSTIERSKFLFS